jgi:hypothetical protein
MDLTDPRCWQDWDPFCRVWRRIFFTFSILLRLPTFIDLQPPSSTFNARNSELSLSLLVTAVSCLFLTITRRGYLKTCMIFNFKYICEVLSPCKLIFLVPGLEWDIMRLCIGGGTIILSTLSLWRWQSDPRYQIAEQCTSSVKGMLISFFFSCGHIFYKICI